MRPWMLLAIALLFLVAAGVVTTLEEPQATTAQKRVQKPH